MRCAGLPESYTSAPRQSSSARPRGHRSGSCPNARICPPWRRARNEGTAAVPEWSGIPKGYFKVSRFLGEISSHRGETHHEKAYFDYRPNFSTNRRNCKPYFSTEKAEPNYAHRQGRGMLAGHVR